MYLEQSGFLPFKRKHFQCLIYLKGGNSVKFRDLELQLELIEILERNIQPLP